MKEVLASAQDPEGVGLAAPQVGESLQIFIIKQSTKAPVAVYINPKVTLLDQIPKQKKLEDKDKEGMKLEGCLSLKDIWGTVRRANKITISYLMKRDIVMKKNVSGFLATIMHTEYDHLTGILFPRRVSRTTWAAI